MDTRFSLLLVTLFCLLAAFSIAPWEETLCRSEYVTGVLRDYSKDGALNCFDFWLNRYQTLFGGVAAIGAAIAAWIAVQKQIIINRQQIAVTLGDIEPDIWLQPEPIPFYNCISQLSIMIYNNNRRGLQISGVELLQPVDALMKVSYVEIDKQVTPVGTGAISRSHYFIRRIHGTRPSASETSRAHLLLELAVAGRPPVEGNQIRFEPAIIRLSYSLLGAGGGGRTVDLSCDIMRTD